MSPIAPIRREVIVPAPREVAFAVFTEQIGRWWPLSRLGVFNDGTVAFVDGRIVEFSARGERAEWGTVTAWSPPDALAFTWHPGSDAAKASRVIVTFAATDGEGTDAGGRAASTLVTLVHEGWEVFADPEAAREEYDHGWPQVLDGFAAAARGPQDEDSWVALRHTATTEPGASVFADPRFAGHAAFLDRMQQAGYLVAAGPLEGSGREGMTVLRLPGSGRLDEARRLAEGDAGVVSGLFAVDVRPWHVVMSTAPPRSEGGANEG